MRRQQFNPTANPLILFPSVNYWPLYGLCALCWSQQYFQLQTHWRRGALCPWNLSTPKTKNNRTNIRNYQTSIFSFLRVCHFVEDRVCTECICVCVRQTFSALIVGCRVCELCDAMCIHIQLNREITMKLILKIVFSLSLLFHTSKWSPAPSSTQFLIWNSFDWVALNLHLHTHYAWTASSIFFLWIRVCFFVLSCFCSFFFKFRFTCEANLNSLHFVFSIDFADTLAFVLRSPVVHSFCVYILMFLLLLLFVGRAQHV